MRHIPVLLNEVIGSLQLKSGDKVIDCTLGDAGHSEIILEKIGEKGKLLGIDADAESLLRAKNNLYRFDDQVVFVRGNFSELENIAVKNNFISADSILMDLGWSTPQFKERGRGFTFGADEPLDMRFDVNNVLTAAQILNEYSANDLYKIFHEFGEEKLARLIAEEIVLVRKEMKIVSTGQLTEIVLKVYRKKLRTDKEIPWIGGIHPSTKVFQALRIAVNKEFEVLKQALPQAVKILREGGRLCVITFHSLEDRIVKQFFQRENNRTLRIVNKKPLTAGVEELEANPSSRSAKLRIIEKI